MRRARFVAAARQEFLAEVLYYAEAAPGLGRRFAQAVEETVALATAFPKAGSPSQSNTRRVLVRGFPFSVYYRPESNGIVVFAIAHHARRPDYWVSRVDSN